MDYEKKYKEALEKIREGIQPLPDGAKISGVTRAFLEEVFPELRESEDETIRKEIIEFVDINTLSVDERHDRWIAWLEKQCYTKKDVDDAYLKGISDAKNELEKQGEQKPDDKVEPKFHKGEWIVWKNKCYKVNYNGCGYELIDQNGLSTWLEYGTVDTSARLYDVTKDAKDGDVLISQYGNPLIYNGNYNSLHIGAYCGITCDDNKFKVAEEKCHWTENVDIKPATKEQHDLLFTKMKEAGYEFDFEKKDLKKIEKKHTEWSEEDEKMFRSLSNALARISSNTRTDSTSINYTFSKEIDWLKSLKDRVQPNNLTVTDEELAQVKKDAYNDALNKIEYHSGEPTFDDGWSAAIWYLKKRNIQPQPKQEWSDDDKEMFKLCVDAIENYYTEEDENRIYKWLKSLKN